MKRVDPPLIGFAAASGTGKTTLLEGVLGALVDAGLRCAVIKATHHDFEIDRPGKDSHRLRGAGAAAVLLTGPTRMALIETRTAEPSLDEAIERVMPGVPDLILVEGFRDAPIDKIEVYRAAMGRPPRFTADPHIVAIATDIELDSGGLPRLDLNRPETVAAFIRRHCGR